MTSMRSSLLIAEKEWSTKTENDGNRRRGAVRKTGACKGHNTTAGQWAMGKLGCYDIREINWTAKPEPSVVAAATKDVRSRRVRNLLKSARSWGGGRMGFLDRLRQKRNHVRAALDLAQARSWRRHGHGVVFVGLLMHGAGYMQADPLQNARWGRGRMDFYGRQTLFFFGDIWAADVGLRFQRAARVALDLRFTTRYEPTEGASSSGSLFFAGYVAQNTTEEIRAAAENIRILEERARRRPSRSAKMRTQNQYTGRCRSVVLIWSTVVGEFQALSGAQMMRAVVACLCRAAAGSILSTYTTTVTRAARQARRGTPLDQRARSVRSNNSKSSSPSFLPMTMDHHHRHDVVLVDAGRVGKLVVDMSTTNPWAADRMCAWTLMTFLHPSFSDTGDRHGRQVEGGEHGDGAPVARSRSHIRRHR